MIGAMVAGSVLVIAGGSPRHADKPKPAAPERERAWLSREAAAQIVGPDGQLGPLFAGVDLGGPMPTAEVRARIDAFARANDVEIAFEARDGELVAIRFAVTFGGCCGYEGADVLALRTHRPRISDCSASPWEWRDDWATSDGITYARARVRVNRFAVRWEAALTMPELIERASLLVGEPTARLRDSERERWKELEPGTRFALEVPFSLDQYALDVATIELRAEHGRIVEVSLPWRIDADEALRARWGRPRIHDETSTWHAADRSVTADASTITISEPCARRARGCATRMR